MAEPILAADGLVRTFGGIRALDGASFAVAEGSITSLIGPNGAGKTTLFNVVTGFSRADSGRASFAGKEIHRRPAHAIARLGMVRTFQVTRALARMTVLENVMLAARDQPGEGLAKLMVRPLSAQRRERAVRVEALELLESFGLTSMAESYAGTLSGGQRKLLEMARALMTRPRLLLLDEPMAGVNPTLGRHLLDHMERLRSTSGTTILFIEHDLEVVMNHSDRVIVMAEGSVIAEGAPEAVRQDEAVIDAYLGRVSVEAGR